MDDALFVRASDRESDPVGRIGNDWGFWDETWSTWHGAYENEAQARDACWAYAQQL